MTMHYAEPGLPNQELARQFHEKYGHVIGSAAAWWDADAGPDMARWARLQNERWALIREEFDELADEWLVDGGLAA